MNLGTNTRRRPRGVVIASLLLVAAALGLVNPSAAQAAGGRHYILVGGTCDPNANIYNAQPLNGERIRVNYPASIGLGINGCGWTPYDQSVAQGVTALRNAVIDAHRRDPGGQFVLVGYSQGGEVVSKVLADIADGRIAVPTRQVEAKLYADPMQPVTGLGAVFPKGFGVPIINFVSPGPGRTSYNGIRFIRYCIETDGICDNRSPLESIGGYFIQHPRYFPKFLGTITDGAYTNGNWFLPRQG